MNQHGDTSSLIAAAVAGESLTEMARVAGVSISTVQRRLREPDVIAAINEVRGQLRKEALGRLLQTRAAALVRLRGLVDSEDPQIALRAIGLVLRTTTSIELVVDIDERLNALEAAPPSQPDGGANSAAEGGSSEEALGG